jgi:branched-chain amino acid transport system permease protein
MIGKFKIKHYINYFVIGIIAVIFSVVSLAGGGLDNSTLFLLEKMTISIILAVSLSLVVGFLGELSLGHADLCASALIERQDSSCL